ncbi:cytochrome P450 6k1-like [Choristoneura fumiferana]|uniref:cytochrome P450 6k1-like n=1 Tax=Choristoneura fumiferana TaxID=7141 RepID=UPI003D158179
MLLLILAAVLAGLLGWLAVLFHQRNQYWARRGIPHTPPHPIVGSFSFLFKKNVGIWMRDLRLQHSSPLVGIWVFWKPVLVVADPQIARRVLIQDSDLFRNRYISSGKSDPIGSQNLFTVNDPTWTNVRRRLTYIFTAAKLKAMQEFTTGKSQDVVNRIKEYNSENKPVDLRVLFSDVTTDIFGTFAFGIQTDSVKTGDSVLRAVTRTFQEFDVYRGMCWLSIFFWPGLVDIFRFSLFPKKTTDFFKKTVNEIIEYRIKNKVEKSDLLDALIKMKKEGLDEGQEFDDNLLAAQATIMLQGGFDTTAGTLTFTMNELAHYPDIQERLYNELVEAKEQKNNEDLGFNDLEKLTYLNCVIKEVLRKYPPMGWLDRVAATDYPINAKLTLPRGTPVYVNAIGMHYDPQYFPDPHVFNPDRFLPENESSVVPFSYMPFGDGPRMCIGMRFAQMTMRTVISEIVLNLQLKPKPGFPTPDKVEFETKGLFLLPGAPLCLDFVPRN